MTDIKQVLERATARPWERREHYAGIPIHGPNNEYVAAVVQCPPCGGKVNAELIVTAVNSFESNRERLARQTAVIEAKQNAFREQRELIRELTEALEGVIRVADRATVEFDTARAVLTKVREAGL